MHCQGETKAILSVVTLDMSRLLAKLPLTPMLPAPRSPAFAMAPSLTAIAFPRRPLANPMAPPSGGTSPFSPGTPSWTGTSPSAGSPPAGAAPPILEETNPEIWLPIPENMDIVVCCNVVAVVVVVVRQGGIQLTVAASDWPELGGSTVRLEPVEPPPLLHHWSLLEPAEAASSHHPQQLQYCLASHERNAVTTS